MKFKLQFPAFGAFLAALFVGISTTSAHAYLDAGTGSMILQLLLGGVAGIAIAGKLYWYRFLAFLGFKSKTDMAQEQEEAVPAESRSQADK